MDALIMSEIIPAATGEDRDNLLRIMLEIESIEDLFAAFMYGHDNNTRFLYMSPAVEKITGHSPMAFQSESGFELLYLITPIKYRLEVVERAAFYTRQASDGNVSLAAPTLMEIHGGLSHTNGTVSAIRYLGMVLEYTRDRRILLTLCTWQKVDHLSIAELQLMKERIAGLLTSFKATYVRIYPDRYNFSTTTKDDITKVVYPLFRGPEVTRKEYEVLRLISNGSSSKQVADSLNISYHTAETHRKHLLEKFQAANTAELVKKASKMFWFE